MEPMTNEEFWEWWDEPRNAWAHKWFIALKVSMVASDIVTLVIALAAAQLLVGALLS